MWVLPVTIVFVVLTAVITDKLGIDFENELFNNKAFGANDPHSLNGLPVFRGMSAVALWLGLWLELVYVKVFLDNRNRISRR